MVSSTNAAYNLTVSNAASGGYALKVMTIVAVVLLPLVLLYQGWSFHVFRARVKGPGQDDEGARRRARHRRARPADGRGTAPRRDRRRRLRRAARGAVARPPAAWTSRSIDRRNHHLFQPLLYQVATGLLPPGQVAVPIRHVVRRQKNVRVELAEVTGFDLDRQVGAHEDPRRRASEVPYDSLIVAAGVGQSYFGHAEFALYAPGMKTIDDALELRRRIFGAFEMAEMATDPDEQKRWLTIAIVGAGPTGVELAGQVCDLAKRSLRGEFRTFDPSTARVVLLDGGKEPLATFGDDCRGARRRSCSTWASSCAWAPAWWVSTPAAWITRTPRATPTGSMPTRPSGRPASKLRRWRRSSQRRAERKPIAPGGYPSCRTSPSRGTRRCSSSAT